jgi:hypothetical protein
MKNPVNGKMITDVNGFFRFIFIVADIDKVKRVNLKIRS